MFKAFGTVFGYETDTKTWKYDCKYYLKDGWWYQEGNDKKCFPCDRTHQKQMQEIIDKNADIFG